MNVRVSEIYASVQGEGPRTGMGTIFLRFGGCNLRCPGWPCDSLFSVLPENRGDWERHGANRVLQDVLTLAAEKNIANVCLTGGEPFIQNNEALEFIVRQLLAKDISVEAFSNGQVSYPDWAFELVNFVMDWKLEGSGNPTSPKYEENYLRLKPTDAIKFVIKDTDDFRQARQAWAYLRRQGCEAQWWAGVVWEGKVSEAELVRLIQKYQLPWNLNVQTHKYLWTPEARGV